MTSQTNAGLRSAVDPPPHLRVLAIAMGYWQSRALAVATELRVAEILAAGPLAIEEIAARSATHSDRLYRLLRALASIDIFAEVAPRVFANTDTSECLREGVAGSQSAWIRSQLSPGNGIYEPWSELETTIRTGENGARRAYGLAFWEFLGGHAQASRLFNESMLQVTQSMTPAVTAAYDWSTASTIVDVGGGLGTQVVAILDASPATTGILFDREHVLAGALSHPRLTRRSGDFFEALPAAADLYLIRSCLHDWSDDDAVRLLRAVRTASRPDSRLLLAEFVVPPGPEPSLGKWSDLMMMTLFEGARERSEAEFGELLERAGFSLLDSIATESPLTVMVAAPALAPSS